MVPLAHPSSQPKRYLDWFSRFCRAQSNDRPTDRPIDHATWSVTVGHTYVRSTAMRLKNRLQTLNVLYLCHFLCFKGFYLDNVFFKNVKVACRY